jgi:tetratricopeptide (TPR) repeat protein
MFDESVRAARQAVAIDPRDWQAYNHLGYVQRARGEFAEAVISFRQARDLLPAEHPGRRFTAQMIEANEGLARLAMKLTRIDQGEEKPADAAERVDLALVLYRLQRHAEAARYFAAAFAEQPDLATDTGRSHARSFAAEAAVLASAGQGTDSSSLDARERTRLRQQALTWLSAELAGLAKQQEQAGSTDPRFVPETLQRWQSEGGFALVRDREALDKLPREERLAWKKFWIEVADLVEQGQRRNPADKSAER